MQHYKMLIRAEHDMTEDEAMEALEALGEIYDAAHITPRVIEVAGKAGGHALGGAARELERKGYTVSHEWMRDDDPVVNEL